VIESHERNKPHMGADGWLRISRDIIQAIRRN